jgi:hypothetical protein
VLDDRIRYEAFLAIDNPRRIPQIVDQFTSRPWYAARRSGVSLPLPTAYEIKLARPLEKLTEVDVAGVLGRAQGFQTLSRKQLTEVAGQAKVLIYTDGETLMAQDEVADVVFVVADGTVHVTWAPGGEVVAELFLEVGESIDLTSMSRQQASGTRVFCDGDVTFIRIPYALVDNCAQTHPEFAQEFARVAEIRSKALERASAEYEPGPSSSDNQMLPAGTHPQETENRDSGKIRNRHRWLPHGRCVNQ